MRIHITGGAGFIGSNLVRVLNQRGIKPIIYDILSESNWKNITGLNFQLKSSVDIDGGNGDVLVHLAANVDTREKFNSGLWHNNVVWPLSIFRRFKKVIYASSAAVYGAEEENFKERILGLKQLNAYGFSKWFLDKGIFEDAGLLKSSLTYGLRFFNVYGPNETHKGDMQSVISKAVNKLSPLYSSELSSINDPLEQFHLFKSDRPKVKDGEQKRDFVFVDDVAEVIIWMILNNPERGVYNVGSGVARSFNEVAKIINPQASIEYSQMPESIASSYQYFTQADLTKLRAAGYTKPFTTLEDGVRKTLNLTKNPYSVQSGA